MSDDQNAQEWGGEMNRPEHENTYEAFLSYTKWTSIVVTGILLFLLFFVYE